jgi:hypothetical protein
MNDGPAFSRDGEKTSKLGTYLDLIAARALKPLESEVVQNSCSTTLLLVFATVDALGGLIHKNDEAGNKERSREFFRFMGVEYAERFEQLWNLRNALIHNAMNVESYLSSTEMEGWAHLKRIGGSGLIYVNTGFASRDLFGAFRRVRSLFEEDSEAATRAADRLDWVDDAQEPVGQEPLPTRPSPVRFVYASRPRRSAACQVKPGSPSDCERS